MSNCAYRANLNDRIFVEVTSSNALDSITYQIVSQARLIYSESLAVPQRNYHVFSFLATFDVLPRADIIVYYFKDDDIISAKTTLHMRDNLSNFVKLKLSAALVRPGAHVAIDVLSTQGSYVGLLAVDQSVLLLKRNADLSIDDAWNERELFQNHFHEKHSKPDSSRNYYHHSYYSDFQVRRRKMLQVMVFIWQFYFFSSFSCGAAHRQAEWSYSQMPSKKVSCSRILSMNMIISIAAM